MTDTHEFYAGVFSSNILTDSQQVFDGRDNVLKEGSVT